MEPSSSTTSILEHEIRSTSAVAGCQVSPSFVPKADATSEDDGYLMTYVFDANTDTSEYVIYDAGSMSNEPVATVSLPRVPFGFHGNWGAKLDC